MSKHMIVLAACMIPSLCVSADEGFTSSLQVTSGFEEPSGWSVGDAGSTHQVWDYKTGSADNLPDRGYDVAGATLTEPTHSVLSPGFQSGTYNFYSFAGDYSAAADIYNHGGAAEGLGTHVMVQIGSSQNPDEDSLPGHGTGVYLESLQIVDLSDSPLTGGASDDALQVAELSYEDAVLTSFGEAQYQELVFEFWLPEYTGDFRINWNQKVHSTVDTLRVDTMIAEQTASGGSPFFETVEYPPGDYDQSGTVDIDDYTFWKSQFGTDNVAADGNLDGVVDLADFAVWRNNLGASLLPAGAQTGILAVPEPTGSQLVGTLVTTAVFFAWVNWFVRPVRAQKSK
ncbi:hypothetical protein NG895_03195 [Aeoliella sp. ICT_H6.2]|uniref:PEP-CTERM sorting domain-containing protein n=1 Tax=Aeoliella straminimaris TaxID=2954799 RepID=A0A9X2F635_9BACT|nr:hypothetical protein [Aeoliella straminimaris]MCO6042905.1 hypothetical protein [Aeoliella straminimaris]